MDLEYLICFYIFELQWSNSKGLLPEFKDPNDYVCHSYSYGLRAIIQCLPAWLRFIQCLRRYRDTKRAFPHLVNAGKYSTTFFVVTFAALYATHREDVILRFAWTIQISLTTMTKIHSVGDIVATVLAPLEVFRRFVWNFFRLENEHLNNCGEFRAVRDISVAPLNAGRPDAAGADDGPGRRRPEPLGQEDLEEDPIVCRSDAPSCRPHIGRDRRSLRTTWYVVTHQTRDP
ncbi:Xenotropic and polytropic retrovirus receptor 1 [Larimichthys crocea]|uniref:Uncharacterized protein n=1 Tax=Larimichthys crocea TaxID=215358 RepID=A0ACD3RPB4_LARCR|nr:Xenotropic and polytropic retrovirus receptor 1 [Larimichthys crocea]